MTWPERVKQFLKTMSWPVSDYLLYEQALTHSSYAHEKGQRRHHNERLEFLGDAVLELIMSEYLFKKYPHFSEGELTKLRADLVCEASLASLARGLNLGKYMRLGRGEARGGGASRPSLLSDAVEALIGALYLDLGLEKCRPLALKLYEPILLELSGGELRADYKTLLQEFSQARFLETPVYRITGNRGPDHHKVFEAEVIISGNITGRGTGYSKKEAEQGAAKEAWDRFSPQSAL